MEHLDLQRALFVSYLLGQSAWDAPERADAREQGVVSAWVGGLSAAFLVYVGTALVSAGARLRSNGSRPAHNGAA